MTMREWWSVFDVKRPAPKAGNLTNAQAEELYDMLTEAENNG